MIFYTSDQHFGHHNIIKISKRPFQNLDEMTEVIISNWNNKIKNEDTVYILGDMFFKNEQSAKHILKRLKGKKHLILGNHDTKWTKELTLKDYFKTISSYKEIYDETRQVILCHYPILEWNGFFRKSYHIYGHIHNNDNPHTSEYVKTNNYAFNAGVDVNNFTPKTLSELIKESKNEG